MLWGIDPIASRGEGKSMPARTRFKTKYPGVFSIQGTSVQGKPEKIFYIRYRRNGKMVEEKAGRQFQDDMTPARAAKMRADRIEGDQLPNKVRRKLEQQAKEAEASRWTFEKIFNAYMATRRDGKGKAVDQGRYEKHLKDHICVKEPSEILPLDIERIRINLLKRLSPQTVAHILNLMVWAINYGVRNRLCKPLDFEIKRPTFDNRKTEDLTQAQLRALLTAIEAQGNIQGKNLLKLILYTGMRRGEVFKLEWRDVDFERGFIRIRDRKGGTDHTIPMNDSARRLLESHPRTEGCPYVFPGSKGRQRVSIQAFSEKVRTAAGLPMHFRMCHGLRHHLASALASSGEVDLYQIQQLLGHKDGRMTQRYSHLRDAALRKAANLAGTLIDQAAVETDEGPQLAYSLQGR